MSRKRSKTLAGKLQDIAYYHFRATVNGQLFSTLFQTFNYSPAKYWSFATCNLQKCWLKVKALEFFISVTTVISHTCPPTIFFAFRKLRFDGRQSKLIIINVSMTITVSRASRTIIWSYFSVNSRSIRVALLSLLDSSINRNWERRLIKSFEVPFRSSRSRAMFWSCKFTNSVQLQWHETELINKCQSLASFIAFLLLTIPLAEWFCWRFALHTIYLSRLKLVRIDLCMDYVLARGMTRSSAAKIICVHNKLINNQSWHKATHFRGQLFQLSCIFCFFDFLFGRLLAALVLFHTPPSSQAFRSQKAFLLCSSKTNHVFST